MIPHISRVLVALVAFVPTLAFAAGVSGSQERAAQEFLAAVATGSPQTIAASLHPDELRRLRLAIIDRLKADAGRSDPSARKRIFGEASTITEIERLNDLNFFAAIGARLRYPGRVFASVDGLESIRGEDKLVYVVVRGQQPEGRGETKVVALVPLLPYGKDWKAAIPSEVEAQIEDLLNGFPPATGLLPRFQEAGATVPGAPPAANSPEIVAMLTGAHEALAEGRCNDYYSRYMSPNFRRVTAKKALETLVRSCERSDELRETLASTLEIVAGLSPVYDLGGGRATYDTAGRGLPYSRFVLERLDNRWYIAE